MNAEGPDPTPAVLAAVERGIGAPCRDCGTAVCGHEVVMSFVLGFKGTPRCLPCLARGLERAADEFGAELRDYIDRHDCWRAGWRRADELDRIGADGRPRCVVERTALRAPPPVPGGAAMAGASDPDGTAPSRSDEAWDAGDLGCGELVLELRVRLTSMKSGQVLKLTARDPGAPQDLPAWCGLTGHALVHVNPPTYFIQRRKE